MPALPTRYVAADIGGTNSRLQLFEVTKLGSNDRDGWEEKQLFENVYSSTKASHLNSIIIDFLENFCHVKRGCSEWPQSACLAVAGPVKNNSVTITNLPHWNVLNGEEMARTLGMSRVTIINDFVAIGFGLLALNKETDLYALRDAPQIDALPKACIGAGTGLGETFLTHNGANYDVWPAEGGHGDFAPRTPLEFDLMKYLLEVESIPRCSVERVVSGPGLLRVYEFLCKRNPNQVNASVTEEMRLAQSRGEDPNSVIVRFASDQKSKSGAGSDVAPDDLCVQAVNTFISAYGAEAGNMALKTLPYGGMYIAGGIAPRPEMLPLMKKNDAFWKSFMAKGRMGGVLGNIPVYVVLHKQVGLLGSQVICRRGLIGAPLPAYISAPAAGAADYHRPKAVREAAIAAAAATAAANSAAAHAAVADVKVVEMSAADSAEAANSWAFTKTALVASLGVAVAGAIGWAVGRGYFTAKPSAGK